MNDKNPMPYAINKFDYSIINIDRKLDYTLINKLDFYIKEIDDPSIKVIATTFRKTFSFLIHHHQIDIYPDKIALKEDELILSQDEITLLIETLSLLPGKTVKAYICDAIYFFNRNNQFSLMAVECYLSHKSIAENKYDECLFFYKMAMSLCNIKGDEFTAHKERIKNDLIRITHDSKASISYTEVYSILSIDKKLESSIKEMFANLISGIALKLIEGETKIIKENKTLSPSLLALQFNVETYANHASRIYKEIKYSSSITSLNANIVKRLLSLVDSIGILEKQDITEQLKLQYIFLAEHYKNNSSRNALSEIDLNINDVETLINRVKTNAIKKSETITLSMDDYIKEIEVMIEKADSSSDVFSLLGQYKFKESYPLDYANNKQNESTKFEDLFKKVTISDDGRTISHNQENNQYAVLFFSLYGALFNFAADMVMNKFPDPIETINEMVKKSNSLPEKIKPFIITGIERWLKGDITSALFILIPQYESFVRNTLKQHSVSTMTTNKGCQDELSLPNLMKKNEVASIFSREFIFEIESLLTDSSGTNLRHKIAHGLLTPDDLKNSINHYICWRWLSIVTGSFNPITITGE